jgi:hypothetical protein
MKAQAFGVASHDSNAIAVSEQFPDKASTDVAGCPGHETLSGHSAVSTAQGEV